MKNIINLIDDGHYTELKTFICAKNEEMQKQGRVIILGAMLNTLDEYPEIKEIGIFSPANILRGVNVPKGSLKKEFGVSLGNPNKIILTHNAIEGTFYCMLKNKAGELVFCKDILTKLNSLMDIVKTIMPRFYEGMSYNHLESSIFIKRETIQENVENYFGVGFLEYYQSLKNKKEIENILGEPKSEKRNKL